VSELIYQVHERTGQPEQSSFCTISETETSLTGLCHPVTYTEH